MVEEAINNNNNTGTGTGTEGTSDLDKKKQKQESWEQLSSQLGMIGGSLTTMIEGFQKNATLKDTSALSADIDNKRAAVTGLNDNRSLLANASNYNMEAVERDDLTADGQWKNTLNSTISGATTGASVGGGWGAVIGAAVGLGSGIAGSLVGNKRATEKANELNAEQQQLQNSYVGQVQNVENRNDMRILANIQKYGGSLLNPKYRLKSFYAQGGPLATNGDIYSNGITQINEGGSHAENPYQGIQIGMDNQGVPNLLEEGEVIWKDYVFSASLKPTKEMKKKNKYKGETFAAVAKNLQKESEERPYDPISQRGLESSMNILAAYQEMVRGEKERRERQSKGIQKAIQGMSVDDIQQMLTGMPTEGQEEMSQQEMPQGQMPYGAANMFSDAGEIETQEATTTPGTQVKIPADAPEMAYLDKLAAMQSLGVEIPQYSYGLTYNNDTSVLPNIQIVRPHTERLAAIYKQLGMKMPEYPAGMILNTDTSEIPNEKIESPLKSWASSAYDITGLKEQEIAKAETALQDFANNYYDEPKEEDDNESRLNFYRKLLNNSNGQGKPRYATWAKHAPVVGSTLQVISDALGVTNKPDYTNTEFIKNAADNLRAIEYNPVGNYLTYKPYDRNYYSNKHAAQANATRRAIMNMSNSNRAQALAGLLAADYNAQTKLGDLYRQEAEYNDKQRQTVTQFNNAVNLQNAQMSMQAQQANAEQDRARLNAAMQIANMRENIDSAVSASKSTNLSNFLENLSDLGTDAINRLDADWVFEKIYNDESLTPEEKLELLKERQAADKETKIKKKAAKKDAKAERISRRTKPTKKSEEEEEEEEILEEEIIEEEQG